MRKIKLIKNKKLFEAVGEGDVFEIKRRIENGENANAVKSRTPILHLVVQSKKFSVEETMEIVEVLLANGADVNRKDRDGNTALHYAAQFKRGLKIVKQLVERGARPTQTNDDNQTARDFADDHERDDIEKWLAAEEVIYRQMRTEIRFFDASRVVESKEDKFEALRNKFRDMRIKKENKPIKATGVPGRMLVMADGDALKDLTLDENTTDDVKTKLAKNGWYNRGYKTKRKVSMAWSWEGVKYNWKNDNYENDEEELIVKSQYQPLPGHQGNFRMAGIKDYGLEKGMVLDAIYEVTKKKLTDESGKKEEKALAKLLLKCLKTGSPITTDMVIDKDLYYYTATTKAAAKERLRITNLLNRVLLLTGIKEITRRMYGSDITLPFAIAYVQGLTLIADGYLQMKDIFSKNAKYGIPTATSLTTKHVASTAREKLKKLNALFEKKYPNVEYTREYFHNLLLEKGYGGGNLTDGEEYETSEDEACYTPTLS